MDILNSKVFHCVSDSGITKYQMLLLETRELSIKLCQTLNPATLLLDPNPNSSTEHSCLEILDSTCKARPDSQVLLEDRDDIRFTDGRTFMLNGV